MNFSIKRHFISLAAICFLALGLIGCKANHSSDGFSKTITLKKPKADEAPYSYVPFEVPEHTESLSISYDYDKKNGANKIELGVFDTGFSGKNADKNGFRGWSGSVRSSIFIAKDSATHGYASGTIKVGKWWLILGRASIADDSVDVNISVNFNHIDPKARSQFEEEKGRKFSFERKEKIERIKSGDLTWFAGDLHTHTFHSDGRWSVKGILESATSNNLDFVSITGHNTFTHHSEIEKERKNYPNLLILNGEEVTTYGGHINVWGLPMGEWVDFRVLPEKETGAKQVAQEAEKLGAIASINHPMMDCRGCQWSYGKWNNLTSVEIWNATWDAQDEAALKLWDKLLQEGQAITAIGSSDSHQRPEEPSKYPTNLAIGEPTVFIGAGEPRQKNIFDAIKKGKVFVAENSRHSLEFTANRRTTMGDTLDVDAGEKINLQFSLGGFSTNSKVFLISNGQTIKEFDINNEKFLGEYLIAFAVNSYIRLEVRSNRGKMLAFTNPIYIHIK